jgi:hypothetical protein
MGKISNQDNNKNYEPPRFRLIKPVVEKKITTTISGTSSRNIKK